MNKRKMEMLVDLLTTVATFLTRVESAELNSKLLAEARDLRPIVEGFRDLVQEEANEAAS